MRKKTDPLSDTTGEEEINMKKAIAVIHARGGSKRIPLKNIKMLAGIPLLAYPILLCKKCNFIDRIIVSTDHDDIARIALEYGAEVPFRRPPEISEDVPSELVTKHALEFLIKDHVKLPPYCLTLTPATPLIGPESLLKAFNLIESNQSWDSVTTIRKTVEHPEWMLKLDGKTGEIKTLLGNPLDGKYNVSQNLDTFHYPTGAFWINRIDNFLRHPSLYGSRWGGIMVSEREAIDIDWPEDFKEAEQALLRNGQK